MEYGSKYMLIMDLEGSSIEGRDLVTCYIEYRSTVILIRGWREVLRRGRRELDKS